MRPTLYALPRYDGMMLGCSDDGCSTVSASRRSTEQIRRTCDAFIYHTQPGTTGIMHDASSRSLLGWQTLLLRPRRVSFTPTTRRAPSRHCRDARVNDHTTTAMHGMSTPHPRVSR